MARIVTQSIPSETRIVYKRGAQIATTSRGSDYVRSRFPWRLPNMQAGKPGVSAAQITQRDRFTYVRNKYVPLSKAEKARWAAANPEYHSYLFGYNFFMLEGLLGGGPIQYPTMIKSIQVLKASVPTTGGHTFNLSPSIDGAKGVVLIQGSARKVPRVLRGSGVIADPGPTQLALGDTVDPDKCSVVLNGATYEGVGDSGVNILPFVSALAATTITIGWARNPVASATVSWEVTEHVEGVVHPVLVSISNTEVNIDWAEVPDAAADVSITVVEYL